MTSRRNFKCKVCGRIFALKSSLEIHELSHNTPSSGLHECYICERKFNLKASFETHMLNHGPKVPYECVKCNEYFEVRSEFKEHFRIHEHEGEEDENLNEDEVFFYKNYGDIIEKSFKCLICNETAYSEEAFKNHILSHSAKFEKVCPFCSEHFTCESIYEEHMKSHESSENQTEKLPNKDNEATPLEDVLPLMTLVINPSHKKRNLTCSVCNRKFRYKKAYQRHLDLHLSTGNVALKECPEKKEQHVCKDCKSSFTCIEKLKKHRTQKNFICVICKTSFSTCEDFKVHNKSHSLNCRECGKSFERLGLLKQHIRVHTEPQECKTCGKTYPNELSLRRHSLTVHSANKHVQCDLCGKLYIKRYLESHMRTHTGERPYRCGLCGDSFVQKMHLQTHMKTHTGEKTYCCDMCDKKFALKSTLRMHLRTHTGEKPFSCEICHRAFVSLAAVRQHNKIHFPDEKFTCKLCNRKYAQKYSLLQHYKTHTETELDTLDKELQEKIYHRIKVDKKPCKYGVAHAKRFSCTTCGKTFNCNANLKMHMLLHTGQKPHKCNTCGRTFRIKYSLKIHQRTHTGERPYECKICGKRFVQHTHARTHMILHTGQKPYSCPSCGKAFADKNNLYAHKKIHMKNNDYQYTQSSEKYLCVSCGRGFATKRDHAYHQKGCFVEEDDPGMPEDSRIEFIGTCGIEPDFVGKEESIKTEGHNIEEPSIECTLNVPIDTETDSSKSQIIMITPADADNVDVIIHELDYM